MNNVLVQHLRIAWQFARMGIVRKSQFQVEFFFQIIMDTLWQASHVMVFEVLYAHTQRIAGWSRDEFRVLIGFMFVSDAFMMIWLSQTFRFGRDLKDGALDYCRVRPASMMFVYMFQHFALEGCFNFAIGFGYLIYGLAKATSLFTLETWLRTGAGLFLCFWSRVVVIALFASAEFWLLGSDAMMFLRELFHATVDRPLDIFAARMRAFLLYVVPMGALAQLPAAIALRRYDARETVLAVVWLFLLGCAVFALWRRGFRRYESALG